MTKKNEPALAPLFIQQEKRAFTDIVEKFQEIETPTLYHRLAYRYELDSRIDRAMNYLKSVSDIYNELTEIIEKNKLATENFPPIISDRIEEIMDAYLEENPNLSLVERNQIIGSMFMDGGEFHGLINEDGSVNQEWLTKYLADPEHQPQRVSIPFTEEMTQDAIAVLNREDLTDEQKDDMISAMFAPGGKYDGYIQSDGSVDESKIKKQSTVTVPEADEASF